MPLISVVTKCSKACVLGGPGLAGDGCVLMRVSAMMWELLFLVGLF